MVGGKTTNKLIIEQSYRSLLSLRNIFFFSPRNVTIIYFHGGWDYLVNIVSPLFPRETVFLLLQQMLLSIFSQRRLKRTRLVSLLLFSFHALHLESSERGKLAAVML